VWTESGAELTAALSALLSTGWCVDNDAYLFPAEGAVIRTD
jgi:hypothetical protein